MLYPDVKLAILELTSMAMEIQDTSTCLVQININHCVGILEIYISKEYDRRLNTNDTLLEEKISYGDDYYNETFEYEYKRIKKNLHKIIKTLCS
jgi:hypothetical protein